MPLEKEVLASESEVINAVAILRGRCAVISHQLRENGTAVPPAPATPKDDILGQFTCLEDYHSQLTFLLRRDSGAVKGSSKKTATIASAQTQPSPQHVSAALSMEQVKLLTLTEKINLASGRLSTEAAQALIASRSANAKAKAENITARLLQAKGCKTVAEARNLAGFNPNPNLE